ncbi:hypothetical protein KAI92_03670 [Candidatus Parcubacteria bacterium]|nr:hypothetical protein [Candidatus Parcubacteria bacterium]
MKKILLFLILLLAVIFLLLHFFYFKNKDVANQENIFPIVNKQEIKNRKYSRITFFNLNEKAKSSLAIPEDWEGKYRLKESGNEIVFSYIVNPLESYNIFSISYYDIDEWKQSGTLKIMEKNDYIFEYDINHLDKIEDIDIKDINYDDYMFMINDVDEIVKSIK